MDTARLTVENGCPDESIRFLMQSDECYRCPLKNYGQILPSTNETYQIDTRWPNNYSVVHESDKGSFLLCHRNFHFRESVHYVLYVSVNESWKSSSLKSQSPCMLLYMDEEGDANIPLYVAVSVLLFLVLLGILYSLLKKTSFYRRMLNIDQAMSEDLGDANSNGLNPGGAMTDSASHSTAHLIGAVQPYRRRDRLKSLDAFRGLSLTAMIFVNYGGGGYWFFKHSLWNGLTVADLVFPWFVFIMGTAIAIVFKNVHSRPLPKTYFLCHVLKRSVILFALGLFLNSASQGDITKLRIPGVLQRIAISYLITASLEIICSRPLRNPRSSRVVDQLYLIPHWIVNLGLVVLWCALTFGLDVPDCGRGYLGPGGIQDGGKWRNCSGGAAGYIDQWVFGSHIYSRPTFQKMYESQAFYDPEGILGSLNSIFLCFLGVMAGKILILMPSWRSISARMLLWSIILASVALILTKATQNEGFIPINKNLWSLSFVLATGSMAFLLLLFFYIVIDVTHVWSGEPLIYPGMNSILIYVCHEVFQHYFPVSFTVAKTHASQIAMNFWSTTFWVIVSYVLYYKKVFVSI